MQNSSVSSQHTNSAVKRCSVFRSNQNCSSSFFVSCNFTEKSFQRAKMAGDGTATCIDILLAIILPPLGVFLKYGCKVEFWICLVLTLFGYIPGIIYAIYAITK